MGLSPKRNSNGLVTLKKYICKYGVTGGWMKSWNMLDPFSTTMRWKKQTPFIQKCYKNEKKTFIYSTYVKYTTIRYK